MGAVNGQGQAAKHRDSIANSRLGRRGCHQLHECCPKPVVLQLSTVADKGAYSWLMAALMAADQPEAEALGQLCPPGGRLQALHRHLPAPDV